MAVRRRLSFGALWIYTTLKLIKCHSYTSLRFGALWIYTTLKLQVRISCLYLSFGALWIYTTLKPEVCQVRVSLVLEPSGFTLLSNK